MRIGASLFLIAIGAILKWAVTATVSGINLHVVGVILMIVGLIGALTFRSVARRRRVLIPPSTTVIDDDRHHG